MKIVKMLYSPGRTGFFFDDQRAIKQGAAHDGFAYLGKPVTDGFSTIRQAGESISIMMLLENGMMAVGDAAAVQYSGAGGRDPLFLAETYIPFLEQHISPLFEGRELKGFREESESLDKLMIDGQRLHTAIRYGISQSILDAVAIATQRMKVEVVCDDYQLPASSKPVPIFGQTGDDRYATAEKMMIKEVDVLPHGLINNVEEKLGRHGEKLKEYIQWLANRIRDIRKNQAYKPRLHIDVYGTIGLIFNSDPEKVAEYLCGLEEAAGEFELYIEGPVDMEEKQLQIAVLRQIREYMQTAGTTVKTVADEWCNTFDDIKDFTDAGCCDMVQIKTPDLGAIHNIVESVLYCKQHGMESYQGGTCNETDISARNCVHLAMATKPEQMLAKPGMGFDEGFEIVKNEMSRISQYLTFKGLQ